MTDETKIDEDGNRYIDMTPTMTEAFRIYQAVIMDGTPEGKAMAWRELYRIAEFAEKYVEIIKNENS